MSTRSYIAEELKDGKYKVIYCHFDGYLEHNGEILVNHYKDRKKIEELLTLGDLSSLAENINPDPTKEHSYEYGKRQENVCVSYNRDRQDNDPENEAQILTKEEMFKNYWIEYFYIFTLDNKWKYYDYQHKELKDVKEDLEKINLQDEAKKQTQKKKKQSNSDEEM